MTKNDNYELSHYNLEYHGVKCTAVDWQKKIFFFEYAERKFVYKQNGYIHSTADTDHIECVILQFLKSHEVINFNEYKDWSFNEIMFAAVDWEKRIFTFSLNGMEYSYCDSDGSLITPEIRNLIDDFEDYAKKKAIEKLIPKKPILGTDEQDFAKCPRCQYELAAMDEELAFCDPYCPACGQAIKWH